jgi:surface antigen
MMRKRQDKVGDKTLRARTVSLLVLIALFGATITSLAITKPAFALTDTYPTSIAGCRAVSGSPSGYFNCDLKDSTQDKYYDPWGEENRECTSYAAWMLHSVNGFEMPFYADAANWGPYAKSRGYAVNMIPSQGSIYWTSSPQHVAWVEWVSSDGKWVSIEDYNNDNTGHWGERTVSTSSASGYIHFKDLNPNQPAYYADKIVQWHNPTTSQNTSWLVSMDLKRYWIPDSSTFNCLKSQGFVDAGLPGSTILGQLHDQTGKWARCGNNTLGANQFLFRGSYLKSSNGLYFLQLQRSDGNLVLYYCPQGLNYLCSALWAKSRSTDYLVLQGDNNLVTYKDGGVATWETGTVGTGASTLVVKDDGNLILYTSSGARVWDRYHGTRFIPGDCNGDGHVNSIDLSMLQSHYNQAYTPCDFNNDGFTNVVDMSILLSNYGKY